MLPSSQCIMHLLPVTYDQIEPQVRPPDPECPMLHQERKKKTVVVSCYGMQPICAVTSIGSNGVSGPGTNRLIPLVTGASVGPDGAEAPQPKFPFKISVFVKKEKARG